MTLPSSDTYTLPANLQTSSTLNASSEQEEVNTNVNLDPSRKHPRQIVSGEKLTPRLLEHFQGSSQNVSETHLQNFQLGVHNRLGSRSRSEGHLVPGRSNSIEEQPRAPLNMSLPAQHITILEQPEDDKMQFLPTSDSEDSGSVSARSLENGVQNGILKNDGRLNKGPKRETIPIYSGQIKTQCAKLLPPMAFMVKTDGSPIVNGEAYESTKRAQRSVKSKTASAPELRPGRTAEKVTTVSHQQVGTSGGNKYEGDSQAEIFFLSPADEMVYIRNELHKFQDRKIKHR